MPYTYTYGSGTEQDPYQIWTMEDLNGVRDYPNSHFIQMADINLVDATCVSPYSQHDIGFLPIGRFWDANKEEWGLTPFRGSYNGNNYRLLNLRIDWSEEEEYYGTAQVGLFSSIAPLNDNTVSLKNIAIHDAVIKANECREIGILAGSLTGGWYNGKIVISKCGVQGTINHNECWNIGGLIGSAVGGNYPEDLKIEKCFTCVDISMASEQYIACFVGNLQVALVRDCFAMGSIALIDSDYYAGGFAGYFEDVDIKNCYCAVAMEILSGTEYGGFVGGEWDSTLENCYYNSDLANLSDIGKGIPKTTAEMTWPYSNPSNVYIDWDFEEVWAHDATGKINNGYPYLKWQKPQRVPKFIFKVPYWI